MDERRRVGVDKRHDADRLEFDALQTAQSYGRLTSILLLGIVVWASCSTAEEPISEDSHAAPSEQATVEQATVEQATATDACSRDGARELVGRFLVAYSAGSSSAGLTDRFFTPADRFGWFHDALTRHGDEVADRSSLDAYFARQHMSGDRMQLVDFTFNGYRNSDDTGHFEMVFSRGELVQGGKGVIDCRSGKIMAWAAGPSLSTSKT